MSDVPRERRHLDSVKTLAVFVGIVFNIGAVIWGAATMAASVKTLERSTAEIRSDVRELTRYVSRDSERISVIEAIGARRRQP